MSTKSSKYWKDLRWGLRTTNKMIFPGKAEIWPGGQKNWSWLPFHGQSSRSNLHGSLRINVSHYISCTFCYFHNKKLTLLPICPLFPQIWGSSSEWSGQSIRPSHIQRLWIHVKPSLQRIWVNGLHLEINPTGRVINPLCKRKIIVIRLRIMKKE